MSDKWGAWCCREMLALYRSLAFQDCRKLRGPKHRLHEGSSRAAKPESQIMLHAGIISFSSSPDIRSISVEGMKRTFVPKI